MELFNWDFQHHFSFSLSVYYLKNSFFCFLFFGVLDLVRPYRKWKWNIKLEISISTKKYPCEPSLNNVLLNWIPPGWISKCPLKGIRIIWTKFFCWPKGLIILKEAIIHIKYNSITHSGYMYVKFINFITSVSMFGESLKFLAITCPDRTPTLQQIKLDIENSNQTLSRWQQYNNET